MGGARAARRRGRPSALPEGSAQTGARGVCSRPVLVCLAILALAELGGSQDHCGINRCICRCCAGESCELQDAGVVDVEACTVCSADFCLEQYPLECAACEGGTEGSCSNQCANVPCPPPAPPAPQPHRANPCAWHPAGETINVWDDPDTPDDECYDFETAPAYPDQAGVCAVFYCPDCDFGPHACDLMCGYMLSANENLWDSQAGSGECARWLRDREAGVTCEVDFAPGGQLAGYCDGACGFCDVVEDAHPGSVCVQQFLETFFMWFDAGCHEVEAQCHGACTEMLQAVIMVAEIECEGHNLAQLPLHSADGSDQHLGHFVQFLVQTDELCNPTGCSTLHFDVEEYCFLPLDPSAEFGCDTPNCIEARRRMGVHQTNCTGDPFASEYSGETFQDYFHHVEHECRDCHVRAHDRVPLGDALPSV